MGWGDTDRNELTGAAPGGGASPTLRRAGLALAFLVLLLLGLLVWGTADRIQARLEGEQGLAVLATSWVAEECSRALLDLETRLQTFVDQEQALIGSIVAHPADAESVDALGSLVTLMFPQVQGALVLDAQGVRTATLGQWPGEAAERHLRLFLDGRARAVQIGSGDPPGIDVAAAGYREGVPIGALSLHLGCATLCDRLRSAAPPGHRLVAVPGPSPQRGDIPRAIRAEGTYPESDGPLLAEQPLGDSDWLLQDRLDRAYADSLVLRPLALAVTIGSVFALSALALYVWIRHRNLAELNQWAAFRSDRATLNALLAATSDGVLVTDSAGHIELFNPAAEMMFGRLARDALGTEIEHLIPGLLGETPPSGPMQGWDPPAILETQGLRRDGKGFPMRVCLAAVDLDVGPRLLTTVQDLSEHERNERELAFLRKHDQLTGLFTRTELELRLGELTKGGASGGPHVLCLADVDQIKLVNDTCGHAAGDELLRQLAILFQAKLEAARVVARLGGDELAALLPNHTIAAAAALCEGILSTVRSFLFTWRDQSFDVAISMGLVEFRPGDESPAGVLSKADVACHMAKTRGRDRIHVYHEGDAELIRQHGDMRMVSTISRALSEGRFHIYAQPITPLSPEVGSHRHFEILVRMVDESGNPMIPEYFIPAAERYILMPAVDRWVVNRLFELQAGNLRDWHRQEPDRFLFAVNLSATSLADDGFLRYLKRQFRDWDVPYPSICFEITESTAIHDLSHAQTFMDELARLGCGFALDDFGAGFASYGYLRELPVSYLKIDGSFVRGMSEDPVKRAMVESINQIGHVLGMQTIAEWAEDEATLHRLRALQVDFAQGFAVGEPIAVETLTLVDAELPSAPGS